MFIFMVFFILFLSIRVYKQSGHKGLLNLFISNQASPQGFAQSVHKQSAHKGLLNLFIIQKALLNLCEMIVVQKGLLNLSTLFSAKSRIFSSTRVYPIMENQARRFCSICKKNSAAKNFNIKKFQLTFPQASGNKEIC